MIPSSSALRLMFRIFPLCSQHPAVAALRVAKTGKPGRGRLGAALVCAALATSAAVHAAPPARRTERDLPTANTTATPEPEQDPTQPDPFVEETEEPTSMTLADALERARRYNIDVRLANEALTRQKAVQAQYFAQLLPRVNALASYDTREDGLKDVSSSTSTTAITTQRQSQANESKDAKIEARQTLFSGFTLINRYRQQVLLSRGVRNSKLDAIQRVESLVKQTFASVLFRQQLLQTRSTSVQSLSRILEIVKARHQVGETTELELLRAETELRSAEALQFEARADLIQSEQNFRRLLRLPLPADPEGTRLQLLGNLEEREYLLSLDDACQRALGARADYKAAVLQRDAAKIGVSATRGSFAPTIEFFANYGWRSSYYSTNHDMLKGWTVGATATMNIFDGFGRANAIRASKSDVRSADLKLQSLKQQIVSQLGELYASLQQSRAALALHRSAVELGQRSLDQANRMYEIGQVELEDLINAQLSLQRAQLNYARALLENNLTVAQLEYASGEWTE